MGQLAGAFQWQAGLERAWSDAAAFVPRVIAALLIVVFGWLLAKLACRLTLRVLRTVQLGRLLDRAGIGVGLARAGIIDPARVVSRVVFLGLLVVVAQLALSVFGPNPVTEALDGLVRFVPNLVVALVIVVLAGLAARLVGNLAGAALGSVVEARLLSSSAVAAVWFVGVFAALDQLGLAHDVVLVLFSSLVIGVTLALVIKFGVGGIWSARDRFWPRVYDRLEHPCTEEAGADRGRPTVDLRRRSNTIG